MPPLRLSSRLCPSIPLRSWSLPFVLARSFSSRPYSSSRTVLASTPSCAPSPPCAFTFRRTLDSFSSCKRMAARRPATA
eukprot:4276054-Pleurochrysis_carterae.AAC.1